MIKEAWLVFRKAEHKIQGILKDGFGHITILFRDEFNWVLMSPNAGILETIILPYQVEQNAPKWLANGKQFTVIKVTYEARGKAGFFPRFLIGITCVSFVKYFLGYKDYSLTPYKLYKNLKKLNKNIIKVEQLK